MKQKIIIFKELREIQSVLKTQKAEAQKRFEDAHVDLFEEIAENNTHIMNTESAIRTEGLKVFDETGEKNLECGVKIKMISTLGYDPELAFGWAQEHKMALKLDEKAFKAVAKAQKLDFVAYDENPRCDLPSKISEE